MMPPYAAFGSLAFFLPLRRERGKAQISSDTKFAQAKKVLANIVCELAPACIHVSIMTLEHEEAKDVHDKCIFLFLIVLICKESVVVDSLSARELLIYIRDLFFEFIQMVPVSDDIVGDISLQALYMGHATLEERMKNCFL
jgi:hypothetical protein